MFGAKAAYLDAKLALCLIAREDPWRGMTICTDRAHHASLQAQFPSLRPHPVLGKWLYLPEASDDFESTGQTLVKLARRRDPRIGIVPPAKRRQKRNPEGFSV